MPAGRILYTCSSVLTYLVAQAKRGVNPAAVEACCIVVAYKMIK